ncbi:hypothetical protein [Micromonospora sp. WMMD712]|uniref:hypothetical protein n=1 Tax=Micromonospora sp. WMMD712 TaxID=3016096 RepID=UPI00249A2D53|nr:hypothetical protein [Micromonospora sp. WMMD712]WFE59208.1 hypothetical protein O7633_21265 [Micromonospora sp. WMMD712]
MSPDEVVTSPEDVLTSLNLTLLNLAGALTVLDNGGDALVDLCRNVVRHTLTAETLGGRHLIAVAGTQGTGKTTLVRQIYGLDNSWLRANRSQGERMPVFLIESAVNEPQGYLTRLVDDPEKGKRWERQPVDREQWMYALRDDGGNVLLLELEVPYQLFPDAPTGTAGLLLLPGYEKRTEENHRWQELMRQSLVGASRALVVTHEQDLATDRPNVVLDDLHKQFLEGTTPLIAISHCDTSRDVPSELAALRARATSRYGVPENSVFTTWVRRGTDGPDPVAELRSALSDMGPGVGRNRYHRVRELERIIFGELGDLLTKAERALNEANDHADQDERAEGRVILRAFDDAEAALRPVFVRELSERIRTLRADALERLHDLHRDRFEGWSRAIERGAAFFSLRPSENRDALADLVRDAWTGGSSGTSPLAPVLPQVFAAVVQRNLSELGVKLDIAWTSPGALPAIAGPVLPEPAVEDRRTAVTAEILRELRRLATMTAAQSIRPSEQLRKAVSLLPALTLEWAHLGSLQPALVALEDGTLRPAQRSTAEHARDLTRQWEHWDQAQRDMVRTWASIAGIDDGTGGVDTVQGLAAAARGGIGSAMGQAVATLVAGSLATAAVAVVTVDVLNKRLIRKLNLAEKAIDRITAMELDNRLTAYEELMTLARRMLVQRLRDGYGLDHDMARREWLRMSIQRVKARRLELLDRLHASLALVE